MTHFPKNFPAICSSRRKYILFYSICKTGLPGHLGKKTVLSDPTAIESHRLAPPFEAYALQPYSDILVHYPNIGALEIMTWCCFANGGHFFWSGPGNRFADGSFSFRREFQWKLMSIFSEISCDFTRVHAMESWKPWKPTSTTYHDTTSMETKRHVDKDQQNLSNI